jgi:thymidylate synthase
MPNGQMMHSAFHPEHQYLHLLQHILDTGARQQNRTGVATLTVPGAVLQFNMQDGFPAITTKKLAFNQVKGELIAFLRGNRSLSQFKALGCDVWDQNANAPSWLNSPYNTDPGDDLGRIYGVQWRDYNHKTDQLSAALNTLRNDPQSRRIIVNSWNPSELQETCLPPCHLMFQLLPHVSTKTLHMTMYQRSCDMFLGVPFNIASYAILLHLFANWSGYRPGRLTMFLADAHIYTNHIDQVQEQLTRDPFPLPNLTIKHFIEPTTHELDYQLLNLHPTDITLQHYLHHPAIKAPMAV